MLLAGSVPGESKSVVQHRNYGLVLDNSTEGSATCTCPTLTWTILEILVLTSLLVPLVATGGRIVWMLTVQLMEEERETKRDEMLDQLRMGEEEWRDIQAFIDQARMDNQDNRDLNASQDTYTQVPHGPRLCINYYFLRITL